MSKFLLYLAALISGLFTLRAPNPLTLVMFACCIGLIYLNRNKKEIELPQLHPEAMSDIAYQAAIDIPENHQALIDKIIFIDDLYREEKVKKSKATFYEHILPKMVRFHEQQKQLSQIPKSRTEESKNDDPNTDKLVYQAIEDWCDKRITAYKENLSLNADIDKDVIIKLTKYL